jgi:plastocyanin
MFDNQLGRFTAALIGVAALTLAAAAGVQSANAQASGNTIVIKNFDYSPMTMTVTHGTTVTWKNLDDEPHTVTSADGLFRSGALDAGDSYTFKFDKPGTYKYLCSVHPKMRAEIIVR